VIALNATYLVAGAVAGRVAAHAPAWEDREHALHRPLVVRACDLAEALVDRPQLPQHVSLERPLSDRLAGQPVCEPVEDSALGFALGAQQNVRWWRATGF
jgi:hypothetical protein